MCLVHTPIGQSVLPVVAASMGSLEPDQLQCIKDGKTSLFRLQILVNPNHHDTLMIAPSLEEIDPTE
jgi:hypothetical protein